MEALQHIESAIKSNPEAFSTIQEAVIQFTLLVSKDFKVANVNLLKACYSIAHTVIQLCGAGPRACKPVIDFCVSRLHDKKIGSDLSDLLSCIAEHIGPNAVFDSVLPSPPFESPVDARLDGIQQGFAAAKRRAALFRLAPQRLRRRRARRPLPPSLRPRPSRFPGFPVSPRAWAAASRK